MKSQPPKLFTSDWQIGVAMALPIFIAGVWYALSEKYEDMVLYTMAMAIGSLCIGARAIFTFRKWQRWRAKSRGDRSH